MIQQGRVCHQHLRSFSKFFFQENSQIIMKSIMSNESETLVPFQSTIMESLAFSHVSWPLNLKIIFWILSIILTCICLLNLTYKEYAYAFFLVFYAIYVIFSCWRRYCLVPCLSTSPRYFFTAWDWSLLQLGLLISLFCSLSPLIYLEVSSSNFL